MPLHDCTSAHMDEKKAGRYMCASAYKAISGLGERAWVGVKEWRTTAAALPSDHPVFSLLCCGWAFPLGQGGEIGYLTRLRFRPSSYEAISQLGTGRPIHAFENEGRGSCPWCTA